MEPWKNHSLSMNSFSPPQFAVNMTSAALDFLSSRDIKPQWSWITVAIATILATYTFDMVSKLYRDHRLGKLGSSAKLIPFMAPLGLDVGIYSLYRFFTNTYFELVSACFGKGEVTRRFWANMIGQRQIFAIDGEYCHKAKALLRPHIGHARPDDLTNTECHVQRLFELFSREQVLEVVGRLHYFRTSFPCCNGCAYLGEPSREVLEAVGCNDHKLINVPAERFYSSLKDTGYEYADSFKALTNLRRKPGNVSGSAATTALESNGKTLTVHPAVLDAAFHSILLAFSHPGDVSFEASIPLGTEQQDMSGFEGDVEVHSHTGGYCAIQVEGLHVVRFTPATAGDDEQRFYAMQWIDAEPDAAVSGSCQPTAEEKELADILERGSLFYLRQLESQIPLDCPGRSDKYHATYLNFAAHTLRECQDSKPFASQ
ncbi:polyketide synthase/peptide synthetase [Metarhizium acridum CQMa 102]|uniref:Polyketide synthase/peptide synthetase n=1 Tax=Metarhizium acridum (strain CQMa 102) TaxID=655827 RepID=E9DZ24_METAQ|nr:polyketide synthase/peptide synthetase [Metarhizium acridum CQMa 102]EFY90986.1 polyketide synthase/peptide synthetase [Metarhizium acridum CQMa 102]